MVKPDWRQLQLEWNVVQFVKCFEAQLLMEWCFYHAISLSQSYLAQTAFVDAKDHVVDGPE